MLHVDLVIVQTPFWKHGLHFIDNLSNGFIWIITITSYFTTQVEEVSLKTYSHVVILKFLEKNFVTWF